MTAVPQMIAGVDEAGRGPLAGPVVAAAVVLGANPSLEGLKDSKKLSEKKREQLFDRIQEVAVSYAIAIVDRETIDRINILQATLSAMQQAVLQLSFKPDHVCIDGNQSPHLPGYSVETIIKGDDKVLAISAASVLAKVTRDRLMQEYDQQYPGYGFAKHKGYGTQVHRLAIEQLGPCAIHRRSFAPISTYFADIT